MQKFLSDFMMLRGWILRRFGQFRHIAMRGIWGTNTPHIKKFFNLLGFLGKNSILVILNIFFVGGQFFPK